MKVTKRNGLSETFLSSKISHLLEQTCANLQNVSENEILHFTSMQVYDNITTKEIQDILIKTAADRISAQSPDYQYVAARLLIGKIRKEAYGSYTPPSLFEHVQRMCADGWYDPTILQAYSHDEMNEISQIINHDLDMEFSYVAVKQFEKKYLLRDKQKERVLESPQMAMLCMSMFLFQNANRQYRTQIICDFYKALSEQYISLPTPIMAGMRSTLKQFSSCVLIECADSIDSISAASSAVLHYISQRGGIGLNIGRVRARDSLVSSGLIKHTGVAPFIRFMQAAMLSCSQGGVRDGVTSVYYPLWHYEIEDLLVLKNNRGIEETRARHLDYAVQINGYLYRRLREDKHISLFSPHEVPDLYEAFFQDQELFTRLYEQYEEDSSIMRKRIGAVELFSILLRERSSTGRIYIMNVDHCNTHSSFNEEVAPVRQSNVCCEITLPTEAVSYKNQFAGEIALCILGAVNVAKVGLNREKMQECCKLLVYALDHLIDYQSYPIYSAEKAARNRRSLGIGVINYAKFLADNGMKYSDDAGLEKTHQLFEMLQYYCIQASIELAKEKGVCSLFHQTKYAQGLMPIDTYCKNVDTLISKDALQLDWNALRAEVLKYGMRNSTLTALMPSETSSQISNSTNGIEPPRSPISAKQSRDGILLQVVPDFGKVQYEYLWDIPNNIGYIHKVAVMQKFVDQAISSNLNYDPEKFADGKLPLQIVLRDMLLAYSFGLKTLYYHNTRDGSKDDDIIDNSGCSSGSCSI